MSLEYSKVSSMTRHEILTLARLMRQTPDEALRHDFGISLDEYRILANVEKGFEQTSAGLARRLDVVPSRASVLVSRLKRKGLIAARGQEGRRKLLATTPAGSSAFRTCRRIVLRSYAELLSPLDDEEREAFDIGTLATALFRKDIPDASQAPDRAYLYIQSYSLSELIFTKHSRRVGFSLNGINILLALSQEGAMSQVELSRELLLPKSSVCELVHELEAAGFVELCRSDDRLAFGVTQKGRGVVDEVTTGALREFAETVRTTSNMELGMFGILAGKIVSARELSKPYA